MIARNKIALVLFASSMIGADQCTGWGWSSDSSTSSGGATALASFCATDPPLTCMAYCFIVDMDGSGVPSPPPTPVPDQSCYSGGSLATQFVDDVNRILDC